jgi:hypothetical protein
VVLPPGRTARDVNLRQGDLGSGWVGSGWDDKRPEPEGCNEVVRALEGEPSGFSGQDGKASRSGDQIVTSNVRVFDSADRLEQWRSLVTDPEYGGCLGRGRPFEIVVPDAPLDGEVVRYRVSDMDVTRSPATMEIVFVGRGRGAVAVALTAPDDEESAIDLDHLADVIADRLPGQQVTSSSTTGSSTTGSSTRGTAPR